MSLQPGVVDLWSKFEISKWCLSKWCLSSWPWEKLKCVFVHISLCAYITYKSIQFLLLYLVFSDVHFRFSSQCELTYIWSSKNIHRSDFLYKSDKSKKNLLFDQWLTSVLNKYFKRTCFLGTILKTSFFDMLKVNIQIWGPS